jgi:hypothetical protein
MGDSAIYTIPYRDLAAVVRDIPLPPPAPTRDQLVGHLRVIEQVMAVRTVIPAAFGTIATTETEVLDKLLAARYDELHAALAYFEGKVELGVRALWRDLPSVFSEIAAEHEGIRALREWIAARPTVHTHQQRIELGRMVAEALARKKEAEAADILGALAPLAAEVRTGQSVGDRMVLNAAFLIERQREPDFDQCIARLGEERGSRLSFKYVGPAPPFNFVTL